MARVTGVPTPEVAWFKDKEPISGDRFTPEYKGNACALTIKNCQPSDNGIYSCIAKNREGEANSDFKLTVQPKTYEKIIKIAEILNLIWYSHFSEKSKDFEAPAFLKRISNVDLLKNMQAKFFAYITGNPFPTVEWFKNDAKLYNGDRISMVTEKNGRF